MGGSTPGTPAPMAGNDMSRSLCTQTVRRPGRIELEVGPREVAAAKRLEGHAREPAELRLELSSELTG